MSEQDKTLYFLPPGTAKAVQRHIDSCKNLALILDKYVERSVIKDTKQKGSWLQTRIQKNTFDPGLARSLYQRWLLMLQSLNTTRFDAALEWRMVVGLGGESVLETDITLHHLYGLPIIPGSALKGLTRAYVMAEKKEYFVLSEMPEATRGLGLEGKTDHPIIQHIFGTQKEAGTVLFFDAFPTKGEAKFVVDIMNPHYPNYYNSLKSRNIIPPANDQSPNPIPFLAVMDNTNFTFALAPRDPNNLQHHKHVELVKGWLLEALQNYGVGGKTSAGYGYFRQPASVTLAMGMSTTHHDRSPSSPSPAVDPEMKRAESLKLEIPTGCATRRNL
jgi:CRISPR type III-B/RAMP module RAMP protein Cmr6